MTKTTRTNAQVILAVMTGLLMQSGRSRKLPSKGQRTGNRTLPEYFRRASTRATRTQKDAALTALYEAYAVRCPYWSEQLFNKGGYTLRGFLPLYDADEWDTREVVRDLRRAIRQLDAA